MAFHLFYVQRYATILSLIVDRSLASCQTTFKRGTCWSHQAPRRSTGRLPMLSASSAKTGPAKACTKSFMATSRPSRACATERTWRFQSGGMREKKQKHLLKSCDLHTCHKTDLRMDKRLSISTKSLNPVGTVLVTLSTCTLQTTWTHSAWCLLWCVRHWSGILVPYINRYLSPSLEFGSCAKKGPSWHLHNELNLWRDQAASLLCTSPWNEEMDRKAARPTWTLDHRPSDANLHSGKPFKPLNLIYIAIQRQL